MFKSFCCLSLQAAPIVICSEYFELNISHREFYWTEYIIPNFRALNGLKNANWPKIGSGSSAVGEERVTSPKNVCVKVTNPRRKNHFLEKERQFWTDRLHLQTRVEFRFEAILCIRFFYRMIVEYGRNAFHPPLIAPGR